MRVYGIGYDEWEIRIEDKVVGTIRTFNGLRRKVKSVYVGKTDKQISNIKNQQEAIEKLQAFFEQNKRDIAMYEKWVEELTIGITQVHHQICVNTLIKERECLEEKLKELKEYDLI